ncbi:MAG: hypothetical protein NVS2B12_36730 [Ktedonobacteraceae bacterium]
MLCERGKRSGLCILFVRILDEACKVNIAVNLQIHLHLSDEYCGLGEQDRSAVKLVAMGGPDAIRAIANSCARLRESAFAGGVLQCEIFYGALANGIYLI